MSILIFGWLYRCKGYPVCVLSPYFIYITLCLESKVRYRITVFFSFFMMRKQHAVISGSLSPQHGASSGCGVAANILSKQSRTADSGRSSGLGVD